MAKKKGKEVRKQINHPPTPEFPEGRIELVYYDNTSEFVNQDGSPVKPALIISDEQLEAWRKEPKEQALKEAIALFRSQDMDVAEQRVKLEELKFMSELQGALQQTAQQAQMVVVEINMPEGKSEKIISTHINQIKDS